MSFPAHIEITTFQDGESSKMKSEGFVSFENESTFIEFSVNKSLTRIGVSPGITTVTKLGEESYTLVLEEGKIKGTILKAGPENLELSILSEKTDFIKTDNFIDLFLRYTIKFSKNEIKTKVRIKCEYNFDEIN